MPTSPPKHKPIRKRSTASLASVTTQADKRKRELQREHDARRGNSSQRGYNAKWQKARAAYLAEHPLCVACHDDGRLVTATEVDHIEPHRGDVAKFWDTENWQGLCKRCHSRKTGKGA